MGKPRKRKIAPTPEVCLKVKWMDEPVIGSLGRKIALRIYFPDHESWWKAFNVCSEALGEVGPADSNDTTFRNDRWFSFVKPIPRLTDKWGICVYHYTDADRIMRLITQDTKCSHSKP